MEDSMTGLGEALVTAYQRQINQWSALMEFNLTADDLSASFGLADDVLRFEEEWHALTMLAQTLQTEYLPHDLFIDSSIAALSPEQQAQPSRFVRKVENYPFTLADETGFFSVPVAFPAEVEQLPKKNKEVDNSGPPASGNSFDLKPDQTSFPHAGIENLSFESSENSLQPVADNISAASGTKIFNTTPYKQTSNPAGSHDSPGLNKLSIPLKQASPQRPDQDESDRSDTSSDSIWAQPLQNLGDFATLITYPVSKRSENIPPADPAPATVRSTSQSKADQEWVTLNEPGNQTSARLLAIPEQSTVADPVFTTPPVSGWQEPLSPVGQAIDFQTENQPFEQATPLYTPLPDLDELLEALTDRILRDFRRYYP